MPEEPAVTAHAPLLALGSPPTRATPPLVADARPRRRTSLGRSPLVAVLLVPSIVGPLCLALYVTAGAPAAAPPTLALLLSLGAWLLRLRRGARTLARPHTPATGRRPARPQGAFAVYIAAVVALIAQATEAWLAHLPTALLALFPDAYPPGVVFDEHRLVTAFPLAGSVVFLFGALAFYDRRPLGEGVAWLLFAWAVTSAAAPFAYLAAAGAPVQYLGGMAVAPLAAVAGVLGARLLWAQAWTAEGEHPEDRP